MHSSPLNFLTLGISLFISSQACAQKPAQTLAQALGLPNSPEHLFSTCDDNGNFQLSQKEFSKSSKTATKAELADTFRQLDKNGDKRLVLSELYRAYRPLPFKKPIKPADDVKKEPTAAERLGLPRAAERLMAKGDTNGDSQLSLEEFQKVNPKKKEELGKAFKKFDKNSDGHLKLAELFGAYKPAAPKSDQKIEPEKKAKTQTLAQELGLPDLPKFFGTYDTNKDFQLSRKEFLKANKDDPKLFKKSFDALDKNKDGRLVLSELYHAYRP